MENYNLEQKPMVSFLEAVRRGLIENYCNFKGCSRRSEYWWFSLFSTIVSIVALLLDLALDINFDMEPYGPIYIIWALIVLLPSLGLFFRRMHDINKSGWNILWGIIPIIGSIILLVFCCLDSKPGENKYGVSPKYN